MLIGTGTQGLAFVTALHKLGFYVVVLSSETNNYADKSRYVDKLYFSKITEEKKLVKMINDIVEKELIDVVIPMGDSAAGLLSKYRSGISDRAKYKMPEYEDFLRGYDKNKLMNLCREKGYPHPETIDLSVTDVSDESVRDFDYPGMLKPNCTTGGRGMIEVQTYSELVEKYPELHQQYGEYHLQKFIMAGGKQEKIQLYIDENKQLLAHSVQHKLRWYPNKGGSNTCAVSIEDEKMVAVCYQILKDINWLGFADFDLIQNPDTGELLIMEMNPRVPACIKGSMVAGINWSEVIVNGYLDLPQKQYHYKTGVYLRHIGLDFLWFIHAKNRWSFRPNWFHIIGRNIHYQDVSSITDPFPFILGTYHNIMKLFDPQFSKSKQV